MHTSKLRSTGTTTATTAATLAGLLVLLSGCTTSIPAPVQDRAARPITAPELSSLSRQPSVAPVNPALPGNTAGSQFHVVQRGETLYGIARSNNVDVNALAAWNNILIAQPLREGQVLRLQPTALGAGSSASAAPAPAVAGATLTPVPSSGPIQGQPLPAGAAPVVISAAPGVLPSEAPLKREPRSLRVPYSDASLAAMKQGDGAPLPLPLSPPSGAASAPATNPAPALGSLPSANAAAPAAPLIDTEIKPGTGVERDGVAWTWPTSGKVVSKFNDKAPMKGIDIAANVGTAVVAAAAGKVIYVGKEPRGFGQMIVVSHAKETVSVYFHTDKLLVKEQQRVLIGQKLAEVGDSAGNKMHFEVRRQGRPLDPISLMPR